MPGCQLPPPCSDRIHHSYELHLRETAVNAGMVTPQYPNADYADPDPVLGIHWQTTVILDSSAPRTN